MKKFITLFAIAALVLSASGCSKPDTDTPGSTVAVTGVTLNMEEFTGGPGEQVTLRATVAPKNATNKKVKWASDNSNVATVKNGIVSLQAIGNCNITVTTDDGGFTASCAISVKDIQPESISLDKTTYTGYAGESFVLKATILPENASSVAVEWSSDKPAVATVDDRGTVSIVAEGTCTITATTKVGGKTATCALTAAKAFVGFIDDWGGKDIRFKNTHPVFSADKKHAYILSMCNPKTADSRALVSVNLETGAMDWIKVLEGTADNGANIAVNPANGDIYASGKDVAKFYSINKSGNINWTKDGYVAVGCGPALNSDGTVVFVAGNDNKLHALSAVDGTEVASLDIVNKDGHIQMAVIADDKILLASNGDAAKGEDSAVRYINFTGNSLSIETTLALPADAADIVDAVVTPDKAKALFAVKGGAAVVDIAAKSIGFMDFGLNKDVYGMVLDKNGNLIATQNGGFIKKFSAASIAGGSAQPVCTILSPTNDNAFNFECAQISATDKVYFSAGPNGAVLPADQWSRQGGLFRAEIDGATGDVNALQISRLPEFRMFQAAFAMTDNYAVVATLGFSAGGNETSATKPGVVYVRKTDDTLAPNTWAYIGGDPCSTKNVKVVYGSY